MGCSFLIWTAGGTVGRSGLLVNEELTSVSLGPLDTGVVCRLCLLLVERSVPHDHVDPGRLFMGPQSEESSVRRGEAKREPDDGSTTYLTRFISSQVSQIIDLHSSYRYR